MADKTKEIQLTIRRCTNADVILRVVTLVGHPMFFTLHDLSKSSNQQVSYIKHDYDERC